MKIANALTNAKKKLKESGIESYNIDSRVLLQHATLLTHEQIILFQDKTLDNQKLSHYLTLIERRAAKEPIAYIIGSKEFFGREFYVNNSVLIPRPDTETLVDAVIAECKDLDSARILEIGVGSGCIIISILLELKNLQGTAVDISQDALDVAKINANNYLHSPERLKFLHGDWFNPVFDQKFDIIVSNPPYISRSETILMSKETLLHEPEIALYAQDEGLEAYRVIANNAKAHLNEQGELFLEIGWNQSDIVQSIFEERGFYLYKKIQDLAGIARCLVFKYT